MAGPTLTGEAVDALLRACLAGENQAAEPISVEGITATFGFSAAALAERTGEIDALIAELPDAFILGRGGGWSFLNLCHDRQGRQWADLHRTMEALCCLCIGARRAHWLAPRSLWDTLPGGMPYVAFWRDEPFVAETR